jgi:hypothetical protein
LKRISFLFSETKSIRQLREACPAHKQNDLLDLVKSLNYNEEKIREKISEWWDEPTVPSEGDWEDVNKKTNAQTKAAPASKSSKGGGRGGRGGDASGRGRSNTARGRGGRDGRGRGGGRLAAERNAAKSSKPEEEPAATANATAPSDEKNAPSFVGRPPQGAWAKKTATEPPVVAPSEIETPVEPVPVAPVRVEPIATPEIVPPTVAPPSVSTGNVWATRGSAHLIKAEKPAPPPPQPPKPVVPPHITRTTGNGARTNPASSATATAPTAAVERSAILSSLEGMHAVPPVPEPEPLPPPTVPALSRPAQPPVMHNAWGGAPNPAVAEPPTVDVPPVTMPEVPPTVKPPSNVLNMGRWATNDTDDANLDFGFGSFGTGADDVAVDPEPTAASPARPPPGLSITGMPPMPANAVLVHELENKLEEVSVSKPPDLAIAGLGHPPPHHAPQYGGGMMDPSMSSLSAAPIYSNPYSSAPGMYNPNPNSYSNPTGSAMTGHAFVAGLAPPKGGPLPFSAATTTPSSDASGANANNNNTASTMPPGMPAGMPYGNPMYYQQQQVFMGHQQPGLGYNYGYGAPFAGQGGGFGYPGGMHGNAAYVGPTYDDAGGVVGGGAGGYDPQQPSGPKNSGGYRGGGGGRHNNNQYQQQYNPQQGYGGQPYGMGYHNDHFNQRGAYQNMPDPYMQQQQQQQQPQGLNNYGGGGFQGDNQYKGKKNNRGGGGGLNQFQQQGGPPMANQNQHLSGGAPSFGLQGQETNQQSADGWPNQGGWSGGGATSWQQGK